MFEKVNPSHPDKVADRIAGALVDLAYKNERNPKIAVEVLIGHGTCHIIAETSTHLKKSAVRNAVWRIASRFLRVDYKEVDQDFHLAKNQNQKLRCGDNGIFKGVPTSSEEEFLSNIANNIYNLFKKDGKYIIDGQRLIICQSHALKDAIYASLPDETKIKYNLEVNPLGYWTGGTDVDSGATNRKLGSDMGRAVTGGGLHGKDLSKADVSVNIYAYLKARKTKKEVLISCAIGDEIVDGRPYEEIVEIARDFINSKGGFEKFAEWGLI